MWIERIEIDGFGRLRGTYDLGERLTVVTGPNEAGKSTFHQALLRAAFGFSGGERRRYAGCSALTEWCPWSGAPYGVKAVIRTQTRTLKASWAFDRESSSQELVLIDNATGDNLTNEVAEKHGATILGPYLIGVDYEEFCQVCTLEQAAIGAVVRSDGLEQALRRAVEMGASEIGVDQAENLLRGALGSEQIGVRTDNLAPLASGRLRRSSSRVAEIAAELEKAAQTREELRDLFAELTNEEERNRRTRADQIVAEQKILLGRSEDLNERATAARAASQQGQPATDPTGELDEGVAAKVTALFSTRDRLAEQREANAGRATAARQLVADIEAQFATTQQQLREVEAYRTVNTEHQAEVTRLLGEIGRAQPAPTHLSSSSETTGTSSHIWVVAGAVAVVSVVAGIAVSPAGFIGLVLAAALAFAASRESSLGTTTDAREGSSGQLGEQVANLSALLDAAGAAPANDPVVRATSYLDGCERRAAYDRAHAAHSDLQTRLLRAAEPANEERRIDGERSTVANDASVALQSLGIDEPDLDRARAMFNARVDAARAAREESARVAGATEALDAALGDMTLDELEVAAKEAAERLADHVQINGHLAAGPIDLAASEGDARRLAEEANSVGREIGRLKALVDEREVVLEPVPSMREELAALGEDIDVIELHADAVQLAREALRDAASEAHQRFAPVLNKAIADDLPAITGGRYKVARINEDLEISVEAPETGESVGAEDLSRGTQDQIYLIERLAILGMLDRTDARAPLLLDDVFVHFDDERLRFGLELLAREASERQVVLFAGDSRIPNALTESGVEFELIELPAPDAA